MADSTFTIMTQKPITKKPKSCIKHPDKTPLVLLRQEYLEITGNHCAAKLLAIFEFWTNKLNAVGEALGKAARNWIYKSLECIHGELMGEHGIHAIRKALNTLVDLGFVSRRHNPHIKYDRTWQYCLEIDNVQKALDSLICQGEQMEDEEATNPSYELDDSNAQTSTKNNIEFNIVSPEELTESEEVFEKKKEERVNTIRNIAQTLGVSYFHAETTLNIWASEWRLRPNLREYITEQLARFGLSPIVLNC